MPDPEVVGDEHTAALQAAQVRVGRRRRGERRRVVLVLQEHHPDVPDGRQRRRGAHPDPGGDQRRQQRRRRGEGEAPRTDPEPCRTDHRADGTQQHGATAGV